MEVSHYLKLMPRISKAMMVCQCCYNFDAFTTATIEQHITITDCTQPTPVQTEVEVGSERQPPSGSSLVAELPRDGGGNGGRKKVAT